MVTNAMERAKMGRAERVQAIRDKGDLTRQKNRAERALTRQLIKTPNEEIIKRMAELEGMGIGKGVGEESALRGVAAQEARRLMNNQFPDPAESLDAIRKRLDALAAA